MDYMFGLLSTKQGNDCAFVVVDWFLKMAILTLLHMGGLFHEIFSRFHYFSFFFKMGGIFVIISMKVRHYCDEISSL